MIVIGERINGMFTDIGNAIRDKDTKPVIEMAEKQIKHGADVLDINVGTRVPKEERKDVMVWLVNTVREVTDMTLSIDNPALSTMTAGIEAATKKGTAIINSTTGHEEKLPKFMKLAKEFDAGIIGLAIDENGVASTTDAKLEIAVRIIGCAMENEIEMDKIYLDPIILPVKADQAAPSIVIETIHQFKMLSDPSPHIVVGLSNLSQGATERPLINRTFITMAIGAGLDASIHDPLDTALMNEMITAEMLLNKTIYSDAYIKAYFQSK